MRKGDLVPPGQAVVRILQADDLWVKVFIPETDLGRVVLGQAVDVTVDSHPGEHFRGHIAQIAHESEFTPRNIQSIDERRHQVFSAKVRVDDAHGVFKSGMAAEVTIPVEGKVAPRASHGPGDPRSPAPLTPSLSPSGRGRTLDLSATLLLLGKGENLPLLPTGEKVPEGRMRGGPPASATAGRAA